MFRNFASALADSSLNQWIAETYWLWPVLEIFHFIGLSLLFGALLFIDLRLLGFLRMLEAGILRRLTPLVWFGFLINLVTGSLFFVGDPLRYAVNIGFQLKMLLILAAGLNMLVYQLQVRPLLTDWGAGPPTTPMTRLVAFASLLIWTAILLLGRLIPYVGSG